MKHLTTLLLRLLLLSALALSATVAVAEEADSSDDTGLAERFVDWLEEVEPIITEAERRVFGQLTKDYQRDAFIRRFWKERDPYPQTGRNELRERFVERIAYARANYPSLDDARARILLVHGEPDREIAVRCTTTRQPAIIWLYNRSEQIRASFALVFLRAKGGTAPAILWRPGTSSAASGIVRTSRSCINGPVLEEVMTAIFNAGSAYDQTLDRVLAKPRPKSLEWVVSFLSESTDLPREAELFDGSVGLEYPGRHQSRTLLQAVVQVDAEEAELGEFAGYRSYDFVLLGEVILKGQLFESFRYKYGFPAEGLTDAGMLPMTFQRYLRPGEYRLILRVQDLNGDRYLRRELDLIRSAARQRDRHPATDRRRVGAALRGSAASDGLGRSDDPHPRVAGRDPDRLRPLQHARQSRRSRRSASCSTTARSSSRTRHRSTSSSTSATSRRSTPCASKRNRRERARSSRRTRSRSTRGASASRSD